ncbi:MAG: FmdB family zinc ribbon protein [Planctomycetota bacterium]
MPVYEYECESCQKQFELLIRSAGEKPVCPHCQSKKLSRLFSTFAAHGAAAQPDCATSCPSANAACAEKACPFS